MTEEFAFNARQYFDFNKGTDDLNDSYFDTNIEDSEIVTVAGCPKLYEDITEDERQLDSDTENERFFSLVESGISNSTVYLKSKVRKSLSMSNLVIENDLGQAKLNEHVNDPQILSQPARGNSLTSLRKRCCSQEHINRLAQPKFSTSTNRLTLAEAVLKFQANTPKRFRSKRSPHINKIIHIPPIATKPHSPKLRTTTRTRPTTVISYDEQKEKEIEEMKQYKIKALPLNKRVLKGPLKPQVGKIVVNESLHKDEIEERSLEEYKVANATAQLVPNLPVKVQGNSQPPLKNVTKTKKDNDGPKNRCVQLLQPTLPKPFSFDKRDQQLIKKKEEFINKVLEEEKKAREFRARPLPKSILRSRNSSLDQINGLVSVKSSKCSTEDLSTAAFKAKPATVLQQKPFIPKKSDHHITVDTFKFSTDQRIEARHKFEEKLKQKEALAEFHKSEQGKYEKKLEEEEVARLRKQMEHKAQPIKKYKEVKIEYSKKVTEAISPKFYTDRIKNKENIH